MILCLCWIQFWQPRRKLWDKWPMNFGWMSGNGLKVLFTEKNISYPWTGRLLSWRSLLKLFDNGPLFFSSLSEKEEKVITFFSNLFSSNCSYGQVECNFDNRYRNILEEGWEMFTYCPKSIQNFVFLKTKIFSPTCSSAHVECDFDNRLKIFGSRPK